MSLKVDDILPSAVDISKKMAEARRKAKASEYMRKQAAADAEKESLA